MSEIQPIPKPNGAPPPIPAPVCLIKKLAEIVRAIDHVEKSGRNDFQKYNYVKAADVAWVVRKELSERNIYLVTDVVEIRNYEIPAREGVMQAVDVKVQFSFFDGDAPETPPIVLHSYGTGTDKGDKAVYKAMTGALKYGLRHAFLIPDESDPEADTKTDKETQGSRAAAQAVAKDKIAAHEAKKGIVKPTPPKSLFYVLPEAHNGHQAELINVKEYGNGLNEVAAEGLRQILKKYVHIGKTNGELLVASDKMQSLADELQECGVDLQQLKAPAGGGKS